MGAQLVGTLEQMIKQRELATIKANLPVRGLPIGATPDRLSHEWSTDKPGWTNNFVIPAPTVFAGGPNYTLIVPNGSEDSLGTVSPGKTRVLVLAIGESGMVGNQPLISPLPAGYPRLDGTLWQFDASHNWSGLYEPTHLPGVAPVEDVFNIPAFQLGYSFVGQFCWLLQTTLGSNFEVGLIPCGRAGTTSADWAVGGSYFNAALSRTQLALQTPNTVLHSICLEQGINDASQGLAGATGWASRWAVIEAALRIGLSNTVCPLYFSKHCATIPVTGNMTSASWSRLLLENDMFASSNRFAVQKPEGPWSEGSSIAIHLNSDGQQVLSTRYMDVAVAHPGITG